MEEKTHNNMNTDGKDSGMRIRIALALAASLILLVLLALYFSKLLERNVQSGSVLGYTMKSGDMTSRMRINLLKAVELEKSAFMAITDEESKAFADQSLMTADTVERDYQELKQEIGLGHFEGRGWRGFHHHATLCIAAYGFLVAERSSFPPSRADIRPSFTRPQVPEGWKPRGSAAQAGAT